MFGAVNLQMASATLATDGITVTIPFTGTCVSPLSPTTSIGGYTADNGSAGLAITSVSASGCTVTLIFGRPVNIDEVPHLNLSSTTGAGFLHDASGNTPIGQTSFVVTNHTEWYQLSGSSMSGKYIAEGSHFSSSSFSNQVEFIGPANGVGPDTGSSDGCVRINANATALDIFTFDFTSHWVLRQGSTTIHDWGESTGSTIWSSQGLVTGLSGTSEYDFCQNNPQAQYSDVWEIRVTGTVNTAPTRKPLLIAGGDSLRAYYAGGAGAAPLRDATLGDVWQVAQNFGYADMDIGYAGFQVCDPGSPGLETLLPHQFIVSSSEDFEIAMIAWSSGYNDVPHVTPSQLGVCWATLLSRIEGLTNPPKYIIVEGLPPVLSPIPGTYDVAVAAACAAYTNCIFAHTVTPNWINNTICAASVGGSIGGDRTADDLHICGSTFGSGIGYSKVSNREIPIFAGIINGASYQFSASTITGTQAIPITGFTLLPITGSTFTGDQTVTLSDGGKGGIITCTTGSGIGSVSLTPTLNTSEACTYTPIVIGSITLTSTNGQDSWINPATISLTVIPPTNIGTFVIF